MNDKSRVVMDYPAKACGNKSVVSKDGMVYTFQTNDVWVKGVDVPDVISFLDDGTTVSKVLGRVNLI